MEPLLEHARMLDEALAKVRLDERRLSDRARKRRRRRVGATGCATAWCTDVALAIAALDDFRPELAAQWLVQPDRRGAPLRQGAGAAEALSLVEERLLAEDAGALATMATPGSSKLNSQLHLPRPPTSMHHLSSSWLPSLQLPSLWQKRC